jgi:tRNA nucleotidyltransferase (CCA-adding enzyme)
MDAKKVLAEALAVVKPTAEEEKQVNDRIGVFLKKLNTGLKEAKAVLGGSGSKGTWLKNAHDADVFVQFNYNKFKDKSDELSNILEQHLVKVGFTFTRLHGSRDYFQVKEKDFTFEIVPVLHVTKAEQAMNITDVSLLHSDWVTKHKKLADEIRLLKQLCKAQGVYGAESFINGFSGYVCEILVINYGGFMKTIKAASKWKVQTIIDVEGYYKNKKDVMFNLNKSKTTGPLIIVDPVQKTRNAAAALSNDKYKLFIKACADFAKKPSVKFFEIKELTEADLKQKAGKNKLIMVKAESMPGKIDVSGSKLLKMFDFFKQKLGEKEFKVYDAGWKWDKEKNALFWFIADKNKLDAYVIREGPPKRSKIFVDYFKKKHKNTFVKNGKLWAREKREFREADKFIEVMAKEDYLKDKAMNISIVQK